MIENLISVPISKLVESITNPRKTFDPAQEKELAESINAKGIVTPLLVREIEGRLQPGCFEIVDGARRFRAARAAGLTEVPAIEKLLTDEQAFEIQLISFAQRVDIHPLDEAAAYEALRKKKFDVAQIAAKVGKERSYIAKRLQLVKLIDAAKKAFQEGEISLEVALEIARLDPDQQKEALDAAAAKDQWDRMNLKELRLFIAEDLLLNLDSVSFRKEDATLVPKAGPCTTCLKRSGNNQDLFGDISKKGNHCLDAKCFNEKIAAFVEVRKTELGEKGEKLVTITDDYNAKKGSKAIGTKDYSVVDKKRANAHGVYVDGPDKGKLVPIKLADHAGGRSAGNTDGSPREVHHLSPLELKERYNRRLEIWHNKIEQLTRQGLYRKIIAHVRWPLSRKEFELIFPDLLGRWGQSTHSEYIEMICASAGIKAPNKVSNLDLEEWAARLAPRVTDQQICQLTMAAVLYDELIQDPSYIDEERPKLNTMLKAHRSIDEKMIRIKATDNLVPKKPKPPKIEEPKKAKVTKSVKKQTPKKKSKK